MKKDSIKFFCWYLIFIAIACSGACIWQFFMPQIAADLSRWGIAIGWQHEIALWNIAFIIGILIALFSKSIKMLQLMTVQATVLCILLGGHHLLTVLDYPASLNSMVHWLGVVEVLGIGGGWGSFLLVKYRNK